MPQRPMFPPNSNAQFRNYLIELNTHIKQLQKSDAFRAAQISGVQRDLINTTNTANATSRFFFASVI